MAASRWNSHPTQGSNLVHKNTPANKQFGADRVCAEDKCKTKLSRYNSKDVCGVHEDFQKVPYQRWMTGG